MPFSLPGASHVLQLACADPEDEDDPDVAEEEDEGGQGEEQGQLPGGPSQTTRGVHAEVAAEHHLRVGRVVVVDVHLRVLGREKES